MVTTRLYWLHCLTPTHAGIGRGLGYIDLPIDRDGVTGWPIIRGSGIKGVWRDWAVRHGLSDVELAFGRADRDGESSNSGALIPTDARIACLPVRSFRGTFAWATSPLCLRMLRRTLALSGVDDLPEEPKDLCEANAHHCGEGNVTTALQEGGRIYLEDLDFRAQACPIATSWGKKLASWVFPGDLAWQEQFVRRFVVLPDSAFDFFCETGTEVYTRVRIDDHTKTVAEGALWTEESLPAETILMGLVQCDRIFGAAGQDITPQGLLDRFARDVLILQLGGKATIGRGQVRCVFTPVNGGGSR